MPPSTRTKPEPEPEAAPVEAPALTQPTGADHAKLEALRAPVPDEWVGKKPVNVAKEGQAGACNVCHGYHRRASTHLDYLGHAAVTQRLLDIDPEWYWEPVAWTEEGLPRFLVSGGNIVGMWIKLHVAGMTRLGFGDADGKGATGAAVKEIIGDGIRNAAMRFGLGLELWHKGGGLRSDVAVDPEPTEPEAPPAQSAPPAQAPPAPADDPWAAPQSQGDPFTSETQAPPAQSAPAPQGDGGTQGREMTVDDLRRYVLETTKIVELERLKQYAAPHVDAVVLNRDGVETRVRDLFAEQREWIRAQP